MSDEDKGLFTKYILRKRVACSCGADRHCQECGGAGFTTRDVDPAGQYFVLRIDEDDWHGEASRLAVSVYSELAAKHNLRLAADLRDWVAAHDDDFKLQFLNAAKAAVWKWWAGKESWAKKRAEKAERELKRLAGDGECRWSQNEDGYYDTACGQAFVMESGTPIDNGMHYCCYCGKRLVEVPYSDAAE